MADNDAASDETLSDDGDDGGDKVPATITPAKTKESNQKKKKSKRRKSLLSYKPNKTSRNTDRIRHDYIAANSELRAEVEEEKKDDALIVTPAVRKERPRRRAAEISNKKNEAVVVVEADTAAAVPDSSTVTVDYLEALSKREVDEDELCISLDSRGRLLVTWEEKRRRRMGIAYFFTEVYKSIPESSGLWDGKGGIASRIRDHMLLPPKTKLMQIKNVMRLIKMYEAKGDKYDGAGEPRKEWMHHLIGLDTFEAQLIADLIEGEFGFTNTAYFVNLYREEEHKIHVGRTTVYNCVKQIKPTVSMIKKRQQGNTDANSNWCRASHNWALQLLVMFQQIEPQEITNKKFLDEEGYLRKCFRESELPAIKIEQVDFWDETHKKQRVGKCKNGGVQLEYLFPRDESGKLDLTHCDCRERGTSLKMKYEQEARFMTGCCLDLDANGVVKMDAEGNPLGKTLPIFEYTSKTIVTDKDWWKAFRETMKAPKALENPGGWMSSNRVEGQPYDDDPVDSLNGIGDRGKQVLNEKGIYTIREMVSYFHLSPQRRNAFKNRVNKMSLEKLLNILAVAETAIPGPPQETDHRKHNNPYFSRYGVAEWKNKVMATPKMKTLTNIRDLVRHIIESGNKNREGTIYEGNWYFYHDALSLMTANETIEWMQSMGYMKHWIFPMHNLNGNIKHYTNAKPIGNHAEAMPWDNCLNKDHDDIVLAHVAATTLLDKDDPKKFSLATPKHVSSAYRRIYNNPPFIREGDTEPVMPLGEGGPFPKRIAQDILKILPYWRRVYNNDGRNIEVNIKGHRGNEIRDELRAKGIESRGGKRTKRTKENLKQQWYHPDASDAMKEFFEESKKSFDTVLEETRAKHMVLSQPPQPCMDPDSVEFLPATGMSEKEVFSDEDDDDDAKSTH